MKFVLSLLFLLPLPLLAQPTINVKSALVVDLDTQQVLMEQNEQEVRPIASITKLMNALVIVESELPLDELITITAEDVKAAKPTGGSLPVGSTLTRGQLLRLSLMNSQNRAAAALGRTYPGGMENFIQAMNNRAFTLGMLNSYFTDPTGLYNSNVSTVQDLAVLATTALSHHVIREFSTTEFYEVNLPKKRTYQTTNRFVRLPDWDVLLQKTGYINDAGRCMLIVTTVATKRVLMVVLGASSSQTRAKEITKIRNWVEQTSIKTR